MLNLVILDLGIKNKQNVFFPGGFLMDDNDDVTDEPKETRGLGMELVANLKQRLTNIPNEYSYFDHGRLGAWAGPRHWKFKPMSKFAGIYYLSDYLFGFCPKRDFPKAKALRRILL